MAPSTFKKSAGTGSSRHHQRLERRQMMDVTLSQRRLRIEHHGGRGIRLRHVEYFSLRSLQGAHRGLWHNVHQVSATSMSTHLADLVLSGNYSHTSVSAGPVAEPTVISLSVLVQGRVFLSPHFSLTVCLFLSRLQRFGSSFVQRECVRRDVERWW